MRVTKKDLERIEKNVNLLLSNIELRVAYRYNYVAIDVYKKDGSVLDTLEAGLTKNEAYRILASIYRALSLDKSFSQ